MAGTYLPEQRCVCGLWSCVRIECVTTNNEAIRIASLEAAHGEAARVASRDSTQGLANVDQLRRASLAELRRTNHEALTCVKRDAQRGLAKLEEMRRANEEALLRLRHEASRRFATFEELRTTNEPSLRCIAAKDEGTK
ncbi:MAG TPA: hypothetical protein VGM90_31855 [Kofleriaceae bacterium]|jgi:hypothetical protein